MFAQLLDSITSLTLRDEVKLGKIPAPENLAPFAAAYEMDVHADAETTGKLATGRVVVLYDPTEPAAWGGPFRVICFAKTLIEIELGQDTLTSDVTWSWLTEALTQRQVEMSELSGTVSRILNSGYGQLASHSDGAEVELRASWTLDSPLADGSILAFADALCQLAGIPPLPSGVTALDAMRRRQRP